MGEVLQCRGRAWLGFQPAGSKALALTIPESPLTPPVASEEDGDVGEVEDVEGGEETYLKCEPCGEGDEEALITKPLRRPGQPTA